MRSIRAPTKVRETERSQLWLQEIFLVFVSYMISNMWFWSQCSRIPLMLTNHEASQNLRPSRLLQSRFSPKEKILLMSSGLRDFGTTSPKRWVVQIRWLLLNHFLKLTFTGLLLFNVTFYNAVFISWSIHSPVLIWSHFLFNVYFWHFYLSYCSKTLIYFYSSVVKLSSCNVFVLYCGNSLSRSVCFITVSPFICFYSCWPFRVVFRDFPFVELF